MAAVAESFATTSQWSKAAFVTEAPPTWATASPGTPLPHAPRTAAVAIAAQNAMPMRSLFGNNRSRMLANNGDGTRGIYLTLADPLAASTASAAATMSAKRWPRSSPTRIET